MTSSVTIVAHRVMPSRGGLAVATSRIATQAHQRGEQVHLVVLSNDVAPGARGYRCDNGVHVHAIGHLPQAEDTMAALVDHAEEVASLAHSNLIHGMYATTAGFVATTVAGRLRMPSIVSMRGNDIDRSIFHTSSFAMIAHALSQATIVTGVSRAMCTSAAGMFDRSIVFTPNSVDANLFRPQTKDNSLIASLGLGHDEVIGYVGELREKKGQRFLLPAFAELCRQRPLHLLLIGGIRSEAQAAFSAFRRLAPEAAERIHILEYARSPKRLSQALALCDVMVFPSLQEGMPNAVLEAMAAEKPVLATAVGGHLDLIEHGKTGALLPLHDLDKLPQAITEMLTMDRAERTAMGTAARQFVLNHHHPQTESDAWANVYRHARALGGPRHARVLDPHDAFKL